MLREIVTDFVLFSGIEGFIFCLFFEKVGGCRKFKWYEWLILSIGNCLISQLLPPLLYQFVCIIWICSFLHISNNLSILNGLKLSFKSVVFFLIFEMIFAMIYEYIIKIDLFQYNDFMRFLAMLPIRFLQIAFIYIFSHIKDWRKSK